VKIQRAAGAKTRGEKLAEWAKKQKGQKGKKGGGQKGGSTPHYKIERVSGESKN